MFSMNVTKFVDVIKFVDITKFVDVTNLSFVKFLMFLNLLMTKVVLDRYMNHLQNSFSYSRFFGHFV